jgi:hypothetical protein
VQPNFKLLLQLHVLQKKILPPNRFFIIKKMHSSGKETSQGSGCEIGGASFGKEQEATLLAGSDIFTTYAGLVGSSI